MSLHSAVLILPAALRDAGDALFVAMGHADAEVSTYTAPLHSGVSGELTHYSCHVWATDTFKATIEAAKAGSYPPGLEDAAPVVDALIVSFRPDGELGPREHFDAVLLAQGLVGPPARTSPP